MIRIKATREQDPGTTDGRGRYEERPDEPALRFPAMIALALAGVVLYLKSLFPGITKAEAASDPERGDHEPDAQSPPTDRRMAVDYGSAPADPAFLQADADAPSQAAVPILPAASFLPADGPPLDYDEIARAAVRSADDPARLALAPPTNDNRPSLGENVTRFPEPAGGAAAAAMRPSTAEPPAAPVPAGPDTLGPAPVAPDKVDPDGGDDDPKDDDPTPTRNRAPRTGGPVHLPSLVGCELYFIPVAALLEGAVDPDGDALSPAGLVASSGTLTPTAGGWLFAPSESMLGTVTIAYTIGDGQFNIAQTAIFEVMPSAPLVGTDGADRLLGTACADVIDARGGDDLVDAREGDDLIRAGHGNDHVVGGAGNDVIFAGAGNDIVFGQAGNDVIFGEGGNDRLFGGDGNDFIDGGEGDDLLDGGEGDDILMAGAGQDNLVGGDGSDILDGGEGDDILDGGDGNDTVRGGAGNDQVSGGAGADIIFGDEGDDTLLGGDGDDVLSDGAGVDLVDGGSGADHIVVSLDAENDDFDGGTGHDVLDLSATRQGVRVDLVAGEACGIEVGEDTIRNFEAVLGGAGDDVFVVGTTAVVLTGGAGQDVFTFPDAGQADGPSAEKVHEILDLSTGDRILVSRYTIYERDDDHDDRDEEPEDDDRRFEEAYERGESQRPFRFRAEKVDDKDHTFIDVYETGEGQQAVAYSIDVHGIARLTFLENWS